MESLWKVFTLAVESMSSRPWAILACAVWIILNIAAQISVARVTLTFDMADGRAFNDTYTTHGIVNASSLSSYYNDGSKNWLVSAHATAHSYGVQAHDVPCGSYQTIADVLDSKHDYSYYCSTSNPEFTYRFNEYNPADFQKAYPRFTDRTITASAGECLVYDVKNQTDGPNEVDARGPGSTFLYGNDTFTEEIRIPKSYLGSGYTTYLYRGSRPPPNATSQTCGDPRCMWMWALRNELDKEQPKFYQCPITISEVRNTQNESQIVSNDVARIAAVSIGLEGRWVGNPQVGRRNFRSYQYYNLGTAWDIHNNKSNRVGENMARFAISSLANMAALNPPIQVIGEVPNLGSHLEIRWGYVLGLFGGIIFTHLALYLSAIVAVRKVVVKDDSFLAVAYLLNPLLQDLGGVGTLLGSKELAAHIQRKVGGEGLVVGPKVVERGAQAKYSMGIGKGVHLRHEWPDHRHPTGTYL